MNCNDITELLDNYLISGWPQAKSQDIAVHITHCNDCQQRIVELEALQQAMRAMPVPTHSSDFADRILARAQHASQRRRRQRSVVAMALAASIVVALSVTLLLPGLQRPANSVNEIAMTLHETQTVQLVLDSEQQLDDVLLSLKLPEGVELEGFAGQRDIAWRTQLQQGSNLLALPLVATALKRGKLVARIEHEAKSKELTVDLRVRPVAGTGLPIPQVPTA